MLYEGSTKKNKQTNFSQELLEKDQLSDVIKIPISSLSLMDTVSFKMGIKGPLLPTGGGIQTCQLIVENQYFLHCNH